MALLADHSLEARKVGDHFLEARISSCGILLKGLLDDDAQLNGEVGVVRGEGFGIDVQDRVDHPLVKISAEGEPAGEHFVEDDSERPDVRTLVNRLSPGLFRRHIRHGSQRCAGSRKAHLPEEFGDPEVQDLRVAI